jgi:hypothetical protein
VKGEHLKVAMARETPSAERAEESCLCLRQNQK